MYQRYALYFVASGALADAGAHWLGWDIATATHTPHPDVEGLDVTALTERPRRYGFHATIKSPFTLAQGKELATLVTETEAMACQLTPVTTQGLQVTRVGSFLVLTPMGEQSAIRNLASEVVRKLDPFRAPPLAAELMRRRQARLSETQEQNLVEWGYPHVMSDFNFHMTLTGRCRDAEQLQPLIAAYFQPVLPAPFTLSTLSLVGERADGMFCEIRRFGLGG